MNPKNNDIDQQLLTSDEKISNESYSLGEESIDEIEIKSRIKKDRDNYNKSIQN